MTASKNASSYRPEIQGIRTIGALLVAVFHIWGGRVSGGVDVFFVISGFLIAGSLYREIETTGTIGIFSFWGRILKRTAPLAYLVLTLTLLAAFLWMPRARVNGFLVEILYSAIHLENIKLMMNAVDYLAREEAPSPVQQFWALSVQMQFYVIWPFLLLAATSLSKKHRSYGSVVATLVCVFLASFAYSVIETGRNPSQAYFNMLARVWEFTLGGIIAVILPQLKLSSSARLCAGWIGLLAIVSCGFVFSRSAHFPGYVALWPTVGAALVLISRDSRSRLGVDRLLASKPFVTLGDISFSFYLWHWPVLIFVMLIQARTKVGLFGGLSAIGIALCGAYITMRWFEQPVMRSQIGQRRAWHLHAMAALLAVPVVALSALWLVTNQMAEISQKEVVERRLQDYPGGEHPIALATTVKAGIPIYPTPAAVKGKHANRCQQNEKDPEVRTCDYGVITGARKTIALVGGSHAEHWLPALEKLAYEHKWRIVAVTKSACPFVPVRKGNPSCEQWNRDVHGILARIKPDAVFTTSTRRGTISAKPNEYLPVGYLEQWERLAESGISVIAIRDNPKMEQGVLECVEANAHDIAKCSLPRMRLIGTDPSILLSSKPGNVSFIDLTDRFCDERLCYPVGGNVLIFRDTHHITIEYARTLAAPLGERMRQVRPDLFSVEAQVISGKLAGEGLAN
jgi:peptidoglycan/LPS O-acetylase OafA/YrhL